MNGDNAVDLVWAVGALVIVGSALAARRLPLAKAWKLVLAWVAIFAAALLIASYLT